MSLTEGTTKSNTKTLVGRGKRPKFKPPAPQRAEPPNKINNYNSLEQDLEQRKCLRCSGSGKINYGVNYITCDKCNGDGMIDFDGFRDLVLKVDIDKLDAK